MTRLDLLGPGWSSLEYSSPNGAKVAAFQECFPNCIQHLKIIPDYWFCGDPNSYMSGMNFLLENVNDQSLKKIQILMPEIFTKDLAHYRKYCGTTPLMRVDKGWKNFLQLTKQIQEHYSLITLPVTTTKYIKLFNTNKDLFNVLEDGNEFIRFMHNKVIFGTVEFDSESVVGNVYKWGLENKLTSVALPVCSYLRASEVVIYGFDYGGPRFYSSDSRHPWNDETQTEESVINFSLNLLKKWVQWEYVHQMKLFSGTSNSKSLPSKILNIKRKQDE